MPWCPKCRYEYREGIKECADCKVPLVEELAPVEEPSDDFNELIAKQQMLFEQARESELENQETTEQEAAKEIKTYQNKKDKAMDFQSSAYILLFVGIIGIAVLALMELHIIPIYLAAPGKYLTYTVMGGMFLCFIIIGIRSFSTAKKYAAEAIEEENLTEKIKTWCSQNVSKDSIIQNAPASLEGTSEEANYFIYFKQLKDMIEAQFGELDQSYLEALAEEIYGNLFDEK